MWTNSSHVVIAVNLTKKTLTHTSMEYFFCSYGAPILLYWVNIILIHTPWLLLLFTQRKSLVTHSYDTSCVLCILCIEVIRSLIGETESFPKRYERVWWVRRVKTNGLMWLWFHVVFIYIKLMSKDILNFTLYTVKFVVKCSRQTTRNFYEMKRVFPTKLTPLIHTHMVLWTFH